jgi:hypothetical protein
MNKHYQSKTLWCSLVIHGLRQLSGLFETVRVFNENTKIYSTKKEFNLLKDPPNTCVKYATRDDTNLTSPAGSPLSGFKILFNPLQI